MSDYPTLPGSSDDYYESIDPPSDTVFAPRPFEPAHLRWLMILAPAALLATTATSTILTGDPARLDADLAAALRIESTELRSLIRAVAPLATLPSIGALLGIGLAWLIWRGRPFSAIALAFTTGGGVALAGIVALLTNLSSAGTRTIVIVTLVLAIAALLAEQSQSRARQRGYLSGGIVVTIGGSTALIMTGLIAPSEVLVGWSVGALWAWLCASIVRAVQDFVRLVLLGS